jgi:hypothetical protein
MAIRNHDIFHRWAHRNDNSRRQGNVSYNGEALLSYNTVIARHVTGANGAEGVLLTLTSYSNSTSGHVLAAWRAIPSGVKVIRYHGGHRGTSMSPSPNEVLADHIERMADLVEALGKGTKRKAGERLLALGNLILEADDVARFYGIPYPEIPEYRALVTDSDALETYRARAKEAEQVRQRERDRKEAEQLEKEAEAIADWRKGTREYLPFSPSCDLLRLVGDFVETSRQVRVPVSEVRRHLRRVVSIIHDGQTWRSNGDRMEVGGFNLLEITGGVVTIGCHRFQYAEVEALADALEGSTLYERATGGV